MTRVAGIKPNAFKYEWLNVVMKSNATSKTKTVAYTLFSYANKENECWPNLTTIDLDLGGRGHGKNMHRHIRELQTLGYISIAQKRVPSGMSNRYYLVLPALQNDSREHQNETANHQFDSESHQYDGLTI